VEMVVAPTKGILQTEVQIGQSSVARNREPPENRGLYILYCHFEVV